MISSMTGFAALDGQAHETDWSIDARSVNHKSLDIRMRLPESLQSLDSGFRKRIAAKIGRGSLQIGIRLGAAQDTNMPVLHPERLDWAIDVLTAIEARAQAHGLSTVPVNPADLLALRPSVLTQSAAVDVSTWGPVLADALDQVLEDLVAMRRAEGAALHAVLSEQLTQIETLVASATATLPDRAAQQRLAIDQALAALMETAVDPSRIEQELALIAVKADVTEELDRLTAHVQAAQDLLASEKPIGRKMDFLMQEFNREANTLCAKANHLGLTRIGLDLKTIIDQMREQVQNVE